MRMLSIDRFEAQYAICEDNDKRAFAIAISEIPKGAKEGDVIRISDDGDITIDKEETDRRRKKIIAMQNSLWKK